MVPKVRAALTAVGGDPDSEAIIADGSGPDALSRALGDPAAGTRVRGARAGTAPPPSAHPGLIG
jgi:hypothetical protein